MTVTRVRTSSGWVDLQQGPQGPPGPGGAGAEGNTVDTFQPYKIIMLSNGTVRAIPLGALPPATPTGLAVLARLSSVRVTWAAAAGAYQYAVYRNGVQIALIFGLSYRDSAITVSSTYSYQVQAVDFYGQRSGWTPSVTAFIDPATNSDPVLSIRSWPAVLPTDGKAILRVNTRDVDAQILAVSLDVDVGTIEETNDPSVWIYTP